MLWKSNRRRGAGDAGCEENANAANAIAISTDDPIGIVAPLDAGSAR